MPVTVMAPLPLSLSVSDFSKAARPIRTSAPDPVPTPAVRDSDRTGDQPGYDLTKLAPLDVNDAALSSTDDHVNDMAVGELKAAEGAPATASA